MKKRLSNFLSILRETFRNWKSNKDLGILSSALSYYAVFSLPGLLVIIIFVAGYFFTAEAVTGKVYSEMREFVGDDGARQIESMIMTAGSRKNSVIATTIGVGALLYSATGVMYNLQQALNRVWNVRPKKTSKAWLKMLKDRLFSFGMIVVLGFLLMISLVISSVVTSLTGWMSESLFDIGKTPLAVISFVSTLAVDTVIFALIYKVLPDVKLNWKSVWTGGFFTAILFELGKFLIGLYISNSNPGSTYGAAGSLILILLWVSYSSLIVFFGAIFTEVWARRIGCVAEPKDHAEKGMPE